MTTGRINQVNRYVKGIEPRAGWKSQRAIRLPAHVLCTKSQTTGMHIATRPQLLRHSCSGISSVLQVCLVKSEQESQGGPVRAVDLRP